MKYFLNPKQDLLLRKKRSGFMQEQAKKNGATIHSNEKVIEWKKEGNNIIVKTDKANLSMQ